MQVEKFMIFTLVISSGFSLPKKLNCLFLTELFTENLSDIVFFKHGVDKLWGTFPSAVLL